jgi:pSer/pThr/pTyr-binding forkhead associated (FHA) protein
LTGVDGDTKGFSVPLCLRAISGEGGGSVWILDEDTFVIGRGTGCHIRLDDHHVSRRHCEIRLEEGAAVLYDRQSRNTTLINGRPVSKGILRPGDVLTVHIYRFIVEQPPEDALLEAGTDALLDPTPITAELSDSIHVRSEFDASTYLDDPRAVEELFALFALSRALSKTDTLEALFAVLEAGARPLESFLLLARMACFRRR